MDKSQFQDDFFDRLGSVNELIAEIDANYTAYAIIEWSGYEISAPLNYLSFLHYKSAVIDICKLVNFKNGNEKYNLQKFLNWLIENRKIHKIDREEIQSNILKLDEQKFSQSKAKIIAARNGVFAHLDRPWDRKNNDRVTTIDFSTVLKVCKSIADYLNAKVVGFEQFQYSNQRIDLESHYKEILAKTSRK